MSKSNADRENVPGTQYRARRDLVTFAKFIAIGAVAIATTVALLNWSVTLARDEREFLLSTLAKGCLAAPILGLFAIRPIATLLLTVWATASLVLGFRYSGDMGQYGHMFSGVFTFLASFWAFGLGILAVGCGSAFRRWLRLEPGRQTASSEIPSRDSYSLASLIATVVVLSLVFGYLGSVLNQGIKRRQVVEIIDSLDGSAKIPFSGNGEVSIGLGHSSVTDGDIAKLSPHLVRLHRVDRICLNHTSVTDKSFPHLKTISSLRSLLLVGTRVSNDGIPDLASMEQLEELDVFDTAITQDGVNELRRMLPNCEITGP